MEKFNIIPIFVPHLGCPNDCVFCNQRRISGTEIFDINNSKNEIRKYLEYYSGRENIELAFYGGSFTLIDLDIQVDLLEYALLLKNKGSINRIRISTRPDSIDQHIIKRLQKYKVDTVELGVQSLDPDVLNATKRNHTNTDLFYTYKLLRDSGFTVGLQQMIGLPDDTIEKSVDTALKIADLNPDFVRIYPTLVIKNTELEEMYLKEEFQPLSLEEAIKISTIVKLIFEANEIPVIRLGLQSSKDLQFGVSVVAGPHHDAIGELVETNILTEVIINNIDLSNFESTIQAQPILISQIVGQRATGKDKLLKYYNIKNIKFIPDTNIEEDTLIIGNKHLNIRKAKKLLLEEYINVFKKY